jgi:glutaminyl-tRNA synthetase
MGVTGATIMVEPAMLDACVRDVLNVSAPRTMVVMDPVKVTIENFPFSDHHSIQVPDYPTVPDSKTHKVALRRVIFIERSDYREVCYLLFL